MGGGQARRLCPQAIVVDARGCRPTPRRARPCSRCSTTRRRSSKGCRSTRRSSTSAGCARIAGTPAEIAARLRRDVLERVGLPITVGVARTKFLAKVASGVAKPDGLLVVPPDGELEFLHPLPVERLWGVGPVTAREAARARHHARSARSPRCPRPRCVACSAGRRAATCTRWRTTAIRGRCRPAAGARSIGSQRALGPLAARRPRRSTRSLVGLVDRVTRRMRAAGRVGPHGRAAAALRRLLPRDPLAHAARGRRRTPQTILARGAGACSAPAMPMIEQRGPHARRRRGGEPRRRRRDPARAAVRPPARHARSTPRSTRCATASARRRSPGRCCSGATRASRCRCCRTDGVARSGVVAIAIETPHGPARAHVEAVDGPAARSCSGTGPAAASRRAISRRRRRRALLD